MNSENKTEIVNVKTEDRLVGTNYRDEYKYTERLYDSIYEFRKGRSYGLLSEIGEGGGGLSWLLSGREEVGNEYIDVFGKKYAEGDKIDEGWWVCEGIKKCSKTVRKQINLALRKGRKELTIDDIISEFGLTKERLDSKFEHYSWESWRVSAAIGYALGKKIFCFPWLNEELLKQIVLNTGYFYYSDKLKQRGGIILLPSNNRKILEALTDEIIEFRNPVFREMKMFNEHIEMYKNKELWYQQESNSRDINNII